MTYLLAMLAAIAGAVGGFFIAAATGAVLAPLLGISSFEGASGYFAAFVMGPIGGLTGLGLGLWLVFRYHGGHRGLAIAKRGALVLVCVAAAVAAGIGIRLATLENFTGGENPQLEFEIRLPVNAAVPHKQTLDFEMQAGAQRSGGLLRDDWLRRDGDRPVLVGFVPLYTRTSQRMLVVSRPGEPKLMFQIKAAATPKPSPEYGTWQRVDFLDDGKAESALRKPSAAENFEIRYRISER